MFCEIEFVIKNLTSLNKTVVMQHWLVKVANIILQIKDN